MSKLKQRILELKGKGYKQYEIANILSCSTGTVSYHCNPKVKERILKRKKIRQLDNRKKVKEFFIHPLLEKEIEVEPQSVCWKHAEAICTSNLIGKGYDVFIPFNGGGEIDLIAIKDNKVYKVQVKSVSPTSKSSITINLTRNSINYKQNINKPYTNVDFILIFDGTNTYKIDQWEKTITLRYKVPSNNQVENINMAKDYIF